MVSGSWDAFRAGRPDLVMYAKMMDKPHGYVAGQMELTSACVQRCRNCQSWIDHRSGKEQGQWSLEDVKTFFEELNWNPHFEQLGLTGGDPQSWEPLSDLLSWYGDGAPRFKLRMNTALALDMPDYDYRLWNETLSDVRVSLDGVTIPTYRAMRGVGSDPEKVLQRMERLQHVTTLTCVSPQNIDEVPYIIQRLLVFKEDHHEAFRKAIFIPVRPQNDRELLRSQDLIQLGHVAPPGAYAMTFSEKWSRLCDEYNDPGKWGWTSFGEQVYKSDLTVHKGVSCNVSKLTFHVKHNGDLYPCCLMGGEALETRTQFRIGNVIERPINTLWEEYQKKVFQNVYNDPNGPCANICLWKQATMNILGEEAKKVTLAMP